MLNVTTQQKAASLLKKLASDRGLKRIHRHTLLLAKSNALISKLDPKGEGKSPSKTAVEWHKQKYQSIRKKIETSKTPHQRLLLSRREELQKNLRDAVEDIRNRTKEKQSNQELIKYVMNSTCAVLHDYQDNKPDAISIKHWQTPLTLILDFGSSMSVSEADKSVSKALGTTIYSHKKALPFIEPLYPKKDKNHLFVLQLPIAYSTAEKSRLLIAAAIKRQLKIPSVQCSEWLSLFLPLPNLMGAPPTNTEWHLDVMNIRQAWAQQLAAGASQQGAGEIIGHIDSGWYRHAQCDIGQIMADDGYNAFTGAVGAQASMHNAQNTHGLATASIMISSEAAMGTTAVTQTPATTSTPANPDLQITGIAPQSNVLPVKAADGPMLVGAVEVIRAAEYLVEDGRCSVISLSLGGTPHYRLEEALDRAVERNMIVVAAGGQALAVEQSSLSLIPVVEPAAYVNVIAVGASNPDSAPASWTFSGPELDFCVPGEGIWFADVREVRNIDLSTSIEEFIGFGHGTSFSCGLSAGVAALWKAFYRDALDTDIYEGIPHAHIFRQHVMDTASRPQLWDTANYGAGIVDAQALLSTPLPRPESIIAPVPARSLVTLVSDGDRAFDELGEWTRELSQQLVDAGVDAINEARVFISEQVEEGGRFALTVAVNAAAAAEQSYRDVADLIGQTATTLKDFAESGAEAAQEVLEEMEDAWQEAEQAVEEAAEAAAEAAEDAVEEVVQTAEDVANTTSEAADALWDFLTP